MFVWMFGLAGVVYASFLWEALAGFPLDPRVAYLSEYAAADSPYRAFFGGADLLTAALLLAGVASYMVQTRAPRRPSLPLVAVASLVVIALATIVDIAFPLPCAESLPTCTGIPLLNAHTVASTLVALGFLVLAVALPLLAGPNPPARRHFFVFLAVTYAAASLLVTVLGVLAAPAGIAQRVQVVAGCLMLLAVGRVLQDYESNHSRARRSSEPL